MYHCSKCAHDLGVRVYADWTAAACKGELENLENTSLIPKPSCGSGALGWVLFTAAQCGGVGFVPVSVDSVPFDYCEAPAQW